MASGGAHSPLRHSRHYTLEQARASMGWVAERVRRIREARARIAALGPDARAAVAALDGRAGGAYPGREAARWLVQLNRGLAELEAVDVVLRDLDRGLVDFPALRHRMTGDPDLQARLDADDAGGASAAAEVYLCWLVDDEDEIGFWHEPEAGFGGRRAIERS